MEGYREIRMVSPLEVKVRDNLSETPGFSLPPTFVEDIVHKD